MSDREASVSFWVFLRAFGGSWFTKMSGPATVPLLIAAMFVRGVIYRVLLLATAIFCAVASAYAVWKRERERVLAAEDDVEQIKRQIEDAAPQIALEARSITSTDPNRVTVHNIGKNPALNVKLGDITNEGYIASFDAI